MKNSKEKMYQEVVEIFSQVDMSLQMLDMMDYPTTNKEEKDFLADLQDDLEEVAAWKEKIAQYQKEFQEMLSSAALIPLNKYETKIWNLITKLGGTIKLESSKNNKEIQSSRIRRYSTFVKVKEDGIIVQNGPTTQGEETKSGEKGILASLKTAFNNFKENLKLTSPREETLFQDVLSKLEEVEKLEKESSSWKDLDSDALSKKQDAIIACRNTITEYRGKNQKTQKDSDLDPFTLFLMRLKALEEQLTKKLRHQNGLDESAKSVKKLEALSVDVLTKDELQAQINEIKRLLKYYSEQILGDPGLKLFETSLKVLKPKFEKRLEELNTIKITPSKERVEKALLQAKNKLLSPLPQKSEEDTNVTEKKSPPNASLTSPKPEGKTVKFVIPTDSPLSPKDPSPKDQASRVRGKTILQSPVPK